MFLEYKRADNCWPVPLLSAHESESMLRNFLVCRQTDRERERHANGAWEKYTVYWQQRSYYLNVRVVRGKIVSQRMPTNPRVADLRLTTAQQRSTGQNLPSDLYFQAGLGACSTDLMNKASEGREGRGGCKSWTYPVTHSLSIGTAVGYESVSSARNPRNASRLQTRQWRISGRVSELAREHTVLRKAFHQLLSSTSVDVLYYYCIVS
jgi:hypothetical protein